MLNAIVRTYPALFLALAAGFARTIPAAEFVREPTAIRTGNGYAVAFSTDRPTDATVDIIAETGAVVRHLSFAVVDAGAHTLQWDGKDDRGRQANAAHCSARIRLGVKAEFLRILRDEPDGVASCGSVAIAVDRDGTMYNMHGAMGGANITTHININAFDRNGNFVRRVIPFRADMPREQISAVEWLKLADGRETPLSQYGRHRPFNGFFPGIGGMTRMRALIDKSGRLILASGSAFKKPADNTAHRRLIALSIDGSIRKDEFYGPHLPAGSGNTWLAFSPDEKHIYISGLTRKTGPVPGVFRTEWSNEDPGDMFIGGKSGTGPGEFSEPHGVDTASDGRIAVCDYGNDRVQIFSPQGEFIGEHGVHGPDTIIIHPKTGAVYLLSVRDREASSRFWNGRVWRHYKDKSVIKFKSLDDWTEIARIDLPLRSRYVNSPPPMLALDFSRDVPVIWATHVGRQEPEDFLWRIEDRGRTLVKTPHNVIRHHLRCGVEVDPHLTADPERNEFYVLDEGRILRYDAVTGTEKGELVLRLPAELQPDTAQKRTFAVHTIKFGPNGLLHVRARARFTPGAHIIDLGNFILCRFDREGNLVPFENAGPGIRTNCRHIAEKFTDFGIAPDGTLYLAEDLSPKSEFCVIKRYLPDGSPAGTTIRDMTRTGGSIEVGPAGELYVAESVRPADRSFPDFVGADPRDQFKRWYGTLIRFDPRAGGSIVSSAGAGIDVIAHRHDPGRLCGALWTYYGVSPMPIESGCECSLASFSCDRYGRLFVPDLCTYSVQVIDSAGRLAYRFGSYGNRDSAGPDSAVPTPEIPLWYPRETAAVDDLVIVSDVNNRRTIQVRLVYAATKETRFDSN